MIVWTSNENSLIPGIHVYLISSQIIIHNIVKIKRWTLRRGSDWTEKSYGIPWWLHQDHQCPLRMNSAEISNLLPLGLENLQIQTEVINQSCRGYTLIRNKIYTIYIEFTNINSTTWIKKLLYSNQSGGCSFSWCHTCIMQDSKICIQIKVTS